MADPAEKIDANSEEKGEVKTDQPKAGRIETVDQAAWDEFEQTRGSVAKAPDQVPAPQDKTGDDDQPKPSEGDDNPAQAKESDAGDGSPAQKPETGDDDQAKKPSEGDDLPKGIQKRLRRQESKHRQEVARLIAKQADLEAKLAALESSDGGTDPEPEATPAEDIEAYYTSMGIDDLGPDADHYEDEVKWAEDYTAWSKKEPLAFHPNLPNTCLLYTSPSPRDS